MFQFHKDDTRNEILNISGNLLIMGGPGSGKTTIALFKAKRLVEDGNLKPAQKVLFLSFARATVSRIEEQMGSLISNEIKKSIEINTYHGFIWNILKRHGYLLTGRTLKLLPPHEAASRLAGIEGDQREEAIHALYRNEGLVHFDAFARLCNHLLEGSNALRTIISNVYPVIILDEFQDTAPDEWSLICTLGRMSCLIALADPNQRIYDFRGADPKRITDFIRQFSPAVFDFGIENNRSNGTDIAQYGNDLLIGRNRGKSYQNVKIKRYPFIAASLKHYYLKTALLQSCSRLQKLSHQEWSIAVLVPTNYLMLEVSDFLLHKQEFSSAPGLPSISHDVAIETAGPYLAALFVALLLEKGSAQECTETDILTALLSHILGRKGNASPPKKDIEISNALNKYVLSGKVIGKKRIALISECKGLAVCANQMTFTGNIIADWKTIVSTINDCASPYLQQVAHDVQYLRLLQRGSQLYTAFDALWRNTLSYGGAIDVVSTALAQEHFSMSTQKWTGVNIMTIHKAKGKEFDEVIIYEGRYQNRIVSKLERIDQARLSLRVAVTRAKRCATILTPEDDPCPLL